MEFSLTKDDIARLSQMLADGNRGGFYWEYYKLTGEYQSLIQGQITTYSGAWGGLAMSGNYLAKLSDQENYQLTLDKFSADIIAGTLSAIISDMATPTSGADGVLTKTQMQIADHSTWASKGLGELFPGNLQFAMSLDGWLAYRDIIYTTGAFNAAKLGVMSLDLFSGVEYTPEELGNRFDEFDGERYEKIDLTGHPSSDGRFLRVIDKQTGHLVFLQDTIPPEPFNQLISIEISGLPIAKIPSPVGITWEEEDYRSALAPTSQAYIARNALKLYLQSDQPSGTAFTPNQVPPNVYFKHELNNGDLITTKELWHQEIMNRIQTLDSGKGFDILERERLTGLFSNKPGIKGVEGFLQYIEGLFLKRDRTPVSSVESYAARSSELLSHLEGMANVGNIAKFADLTNYTSSQLANLASKNGAEGVAIRYSLIKLSPLALIGSSEIYSDHKNLSLDLFNENWLSDRAVMLKALMDAGFGNTPQTSFAFTDKNTNQHTITSPEYFSTDNGEIIFGELDNANADERSLEGSIKQDRIYGGSKGDSINAGDLNDTLYGMNGNDTISGNDGSDLLFGMSDNDILNGEAGDDELYGGGGDDVLNGGSGNDILEGGEGDDTYIIDGTAGSDTIIDDGGTIKYNDKKLTGGKATHLGSKVWQEGSVIYTLMDLGASKNLIIKVGANTVTIKDWISGHFDITLKDADQTSPATMDRVIVGDKETVDVDPLTDGVQSKIDDLGNIVTNPAVDETNREDWLRDGVGNDEIYTKSGDDEVEATRGGNNLIDGGSGSDRVLAGNGNDTLIGGTESDRLTAGQGDDQIFAEEQMADAEIIAANQVQNAIAERGDLLGGGGGDDLLVGHRRNDLLYGGSGSDTLWGGAGDDVLYGDVELLGAAKDWEVQKVVQVRDNLTEYFTPVTGIHFELEAKTGNYDDFLYGGAGNDWIFSGYGNDVVEGGLGNDVIFGQDDNDYLVGGDGDDVLVGDHGVSSIGNTGDDLLVGGAGNDKLYGDGGNDILFGGDDDDELSGDNGQSDPSLHGDDILDGGLGNDTLYGGGGNDRLTGGDGNDLLQGDYVESVLAAVHHGSDVLIGGKGNDTMSGGAGRDELYGNEDDDQIAGDGLIESPLSLYEMSDYVDGGAGNDTLWGDAGNDTLIGGIGDDHLEGDNSLSAAEHQGRDLLDGGEGNDELLGQGNEDTLEGGAGNDSLWGGTGNDVLSGGTGYDYLSGDEGNDTYVFNVGDGQKASDGSDEFIDDRQGQNTILFGAGIGIGDIEFYQYINGPVRLKYGATDFVMLKDGLTGNTQTLKFANGTSYNIQDFYTTYSQDDLDAFTNASNATLIGSSIANTITGNGGGSSFRGGRGNDTLVGTGGGNIYSYNRGDGIDQIYDTDARFGYSLPNDRPANRISFGRGITQGDITLSLGAANTLLVSVAGDPPGQLVIHNFDPSDAAESQVIGFFDFADGTSVSYQDLLGNGFIEVGSGGSDAISGSNLNDQLSGGAGNDTLVGGAGNDRLLGEAGEDSLRGDAGNDTLIGGAGADTLNGGEGADTYLYALGDGSDTLVESVDGSVNVLKFSAGIDPFGVSLIAGSEQSLIIEIAATGDRLTLANWLRADSPTIQRIEFDNGDLWTPEMIRQRLATITGTADDDTLTAAAGANATLYGLDGQDSLVGNTGNDSLYGAQGSDTLLGGDGNDFLDGGSGNDYLYGGVGSDTYFFDRGYGEDSISDASPEANDVVVFGHGIVRGNVSFRRTYGGELSILISGSDDKLTIENYFNRSDTGDTGPYLSTIKEFRFADGTVVNEAEVRQLALQGTENTDYLTGGAGADSLNGLGGDDYLDGRGGDDVLKGGDGNDRIDGGAGNDTLIGGQGADYIEDGAGVNWVDPGAGNDTIYLTPQSTLVFGAGYGEDKTTLSRVNITHGSVAGDWRYIRSIDDLLIVNKTNYNDRLRIDKFFSTNTQNVQTKTNYFSLNFSDGTVVKDIPLSQMSGICLDLRMDTYYLSGAYYTSTAYSPNADTIGQYGSFASGGYFVGGSHIGNDILYGSNWDDTIDGRDGDDVLYGMAGRDTFYAESGNDTLVGGQGDDRYSLGAAAGNKTIIINAGDGNDVLNATGAQVLVRLDDFKADELAFRRSSRDLIIDFLSDGGSLKIQSFMDFSMGVSSYYSTLMVRAADGVFLDATALRSRLIESNHAPTVGRIDLSVPTGAASLISLNDFMGGITDQESDAIYMSEVISAVGGHAFYSPDLNGVVFIPEEGFIGQASFVFSVTDGLAISRGIAHIEVMPSLTVNKDSVLTLSSAALLASDAEGANDGETILDAWIEDNSTGILTFNPQTGAITITPSAGFSGITSIAYTTTSGTYSSFIVVDNASNQTRSGTSSADFIEGGCGNDTLNGSGGADALVGGQGNDRLNGGSGADLMLGGSGDDTYVVDNIEDVVMESANSGVDTIESSISISLAANVENLLLTGSGSISGTGNDLDNTLTGNAGANLLVGGAGNDHLDGKAGSDTMQGGLGNDIYVVERTTDVVTEGFGEGIDTIESSVTLTLGDNVENLILTGSSALNGTGNALDNILIGNSGANILVGGAGNDRLDGGAGNDTMRGGLGDDTYVVNATGDSVMENANEGIDTIESSITLTLGNNVENLTLTGSSALNGTGNSLNNVLVGNAGANSLTGAAGNDRLDGLAGADTLTGGVGNDTYVFGRGYGADTVVENDTTAGNNDAAQFLVGIAAEQLWFRRVSGTSNLEVSIIGTSDKLTVKDWYLGSAYHVEQFRTSDGKTLLDSQVQNLVNAMAAFAPPPGGSSNLTPEQRAQLEVVIAANWH